MSAMEGAPKFSSNSFEGNRPQKPGAHDLGAYDQLLAGLKEKVANINVKKEDDTELESTGSVNVGESSAEEEGDFMQQSRLSDDGSIILTTREKGVLSETIYTAQKRHYDNRLR